VKLLSIAGRRRPRIGRAGDRHRLVIPALAIVAMTPSIGGIGATPAEAAEAAKAAEPVGASATADPARDRADPPVDVICKAAVAQAMAEPERARGFISRARVAGWLPEMRFRVFRRFARTEGLTLTDAATGAPVDVSAVDDVRYEWRATWDLSRMVFNPDELQAHSEALRMSDVRRDIQSLVIRLYFERRRLLVAPTAGQKRAGDPTGEGPGSDAGGDPRRRLRILELEAQLDALSDGAFSAGARPGAQVAP
jgi:hypothetical protein